MSVFYLVELAKKKENEVMSRRNLSTGRIYLLSLLETNAYVNQGKSPLKDLRPFSKCHN